MLDRPLATRCQHALVTWLRARGKLAFLKSLPRGAKVLNAISAQAGRMDVVISSHNLEHCDDPSAVLTAMMAALRAFPCEESVRLPSRRGTLNFFDDGTHRAVPRWEPVMDSLRKSGALWSMHAGDAGPRSWQASG